MLLNILSLKDAYSGSGYRPGRASIYMHKVKLVRDSTGPTISRVGWSRDRAKPSLPDPPHTFTNSCHVYVCILDDWEFTALSCSSCHPFIFAYIGADTLHMSPLYIAGLADIECTISRAHTSDRKQELSQSLGL